MSQTWWRRNRLWLALLLPSLALALAASAFRLTSLYLPYEWSAPTVPGGTAGTLTQRFLGFDDERHTRRVGVTVVDVEQTPELDGSAAIDGATLWRVELEFTAAPDQLLAGPCTIQLKGDDGAHYGYSGGRTAADPDDPTYFPPVMAPGCVPPETPGPDIEPYTGELVAAETPRPETWRVTTSMVLPSSVTPVEVRVGWTPPEHLVLALP